VRALHLSPAPRIPDRTRKVRNRDQVPATAIPAERVREMLLEIAFVLHATRVVAKMESRVADEPGGNEAVEAGTRDGATNPGEEEAVGLPASRRWPRLDFGCRLRKLTDRSQVDLRRVAEARTDPGGVCDPPPGSPDARLGGWLNEK